MDDLHCQRADIDPGQSMDHSSVSSRGVRVSSVAYLFVPYDNFHFYDVDRFLPELMTFVTTAIPRRKSDARTHRTPKALRAKFTIAHCGFAKLLECAQPARLGAGVLASLSQRFTLNNG